MGQNEKLRADDGTPLEIKEGVVVDQQGNELGPRGHHSSYREPFSRNRVFVFKSNGWLAPILIAPLLIVVLSIGITLFAGIAIAAFVAWIIYFLVRGLRRL